MSTSEGKKPKDKEPKDDDDCRERCLGVNDVIDYHGKRHTPHWWKMYTKWCDGKITG